MGVNGTYLTMGNNYRFVISKYGMNENNIKGCWKRKCVNESGVIRTDVSTTELGDWRMNNYIVRSYRDVITKFAITKYAIRRASKAQSIVMY